jgi:capsular exopolysaccharide synthesis family protein
VSKIFEALQKTEKAIANLEMPIQGPKNGPAAAEAPPPAEVPAEVLEQPARASRVRTLPICLPESSPLLPFDGVYPAAGEQYRILRTNLLRYPKPLRVLAISSAGSGDGKTLSAINTAGALAMKPDVTTLLMDGDLRRSTLARALGLPESPGLAEVIEGECELDDALIRTEQFPNLHVLPAGKPKGNPAELLDSPRWRELCAAVRERFRFVVIDTAPVASVADFDLIEAVCDGVVLVARPDHSNRTLCLKALEKVPREKLVGVLLNCMEDWWLQPSHGSYYYYALASKK